MSYELALEKAGAKVLNFKEFGSYQGDWIALVEYNGEKGFVEGAYGSCSGCDAFEGQFGFRDMPKEKDGKYYANGNYWDEDDECSKEIFDEFNAKYEQELAEFGKSYLTPPLYDKAFYQSKLDKMNSAGEFDWFSDEEKELCEWALNQSF